MPCSHIGFPIIWYYEMFFNKPLDIINIKENLKSFKECIELQLLS